MAKLELYASVPPLSTHTFPLFRHSEKTSKLTFGRASYIIPITPKGTERLVKCKPFGSVRSSSTLFKGLGNDATLRISAAMPLMRSSVSIRRSYSGFDFSIFAKSCSLALSSRNDAASAASATSSRTLFISSLDTRLSFLEASRANSFQFCSIFIGELVNQ